MCVEQSSFLFSWRITHIPQTRQNSLARVRGEMDDVFSEMSRSSTIAVDLALRQSPPPPAHSTPLTPPAHSAPQLLSPSPPLSSGNSPINRLPDAIAARVMALLDSADHSACARLSTRFRALARLRESFPESVRVRDCSLEKATSALWRMRPSARLEIRLVPSPLTGLPTIGDTVAAPPITAPFCGSALRLLADQPRMRQLVIASTAAIGCTGQDMARLWSAAFGDVQRASQPAKQPYGRSSPLGEAALWPATQPFGEKRPLGHQSSPPASEAAQRGRSSPTDDDLDRVPRPFPACTSFRTEMRESSVTELLLRRMPKLLELDCTTLTSEIVRRLSQYTPHLVTLRVAQDVDVLAGVTWSALAQLDRLRTLELPGSIVQTMDLARLPRLETLCAEWCSMHSDQSPAAPPHRLRHLTMTTDRSQARRLMTWFPALSTAEITVDSMRAQLVMRLDARSVTFRAHAATKGDDDVVFGGYAIADALLGSLRQPPLSCAFDDSVSPALRAVLVRDFARLAKAPPPPLLDSDPDSDAEIECDAEAEARTRNMIPHARALRSTA